MKNTSANNKGKKFLKDLGFFLLIIVILVPVAFGATYIPWSILKFQKIIWSASIYSAQLFKITSFVIWVVGVFVVIATMIKYGFFSYTKLVNKSNRAESDAYGNSRWQTESEMTENYGCYAWSKLEDAAAEGIIVRSYIRNNELYVSTIKSQHCLIAGAPGTGKSTRFLGPSIQMNAKSKTKASMIINDLKGELYDVHAPMLRAAGYDVIKFDLGHPSDPNNTHFNPLSLVWELYQDYIANGKEDSELIDQVSLLINEVALLICPESTGENAQWAQGAQGIVTAVIWGMLEDGIIPEYDMTSDKFTIAQISNIVNRQRSYLEDFLKHRSRKSPVFDHAGNILDNPSEKTVASYLSTLSTNLKVFLEEGVKRITAFTDFDITVMNRRPTALFIVLPERQQTRNVVGTMLLQQIYNQVTYEVSKTSDKSVFRPIYFLLDEFGNLPKMKNLPRQIALGRSQGIFYILVVQADSQIEAVYGEHDARTITNNAQVQMLLGTNSIPTLKRFSELFGKYTIYQRSANIDQKTSTTDFKGTTSLTSKELITLDQLQRIPEGTAYFKTLRDFPCKTNLVAEWNKRANKIIFNQHSRLIATIRRTPKTHKEEIYDLENRERYWSLFADSLAATKKPQKTGIEPAAELEDETSSQDEINAESPQKTDSVKNNLRFLQN